MKRDRAGYWRTLKNCGNKLQPSLQPHNRFYRSLHRRRGHQGTEMAICATLHGSAEAAFMQGPLTPRPTLTTTAWNKPSLLSNQNQKTELELCFRQIPSNLYHHWPRNLPANNGALSVIRDQMVSPKFVQPDSQLSSCMVSYPDLIYKQKLPTSCCGCKDWMMEHTESTEKRLDIDGPSPVLTIWDPVSKTKKGTHPLDVHLSH